MQADRMAMPDNFNNETIGGKMDSLIGVVVLAAAGWFLFCEGLRRGSRKGYGVGRSRGRRRRRQTKR